MYKAFAAYKAFTALLVALAFNPTFTGRHLDAHKWATCYPWIANPEKGCTGSVEKDWYLPSGVKVSHGDLNLVATKKASHGYPYTSGMVSTYKSFTFTYGYVQIEAKLPGGAGTWPALWLLPTTENWPPEIDIMENHGEAHQISTTVHWATPLGPRQDAKDTNTVSNLTTGYHTYALRWTKSTLTWYLDGKVIHTYTGPNVPAVPMYLLANMAIDGPAKSGSTLSIKSVKIYRTG